MDLNTAIKERRSIRRFTDKPIGKETIEKIVDLARFAPSWKNTQISRYIIVENKEIIEKIGSECGKTFEMNGKTISGATNLALVTIINGRSGFEKDGSFTTSKGDRWEMFDAGIAVQTFCLAAHQEGVGTVIMGVFDEEEIGKIVDIPEGSQLAAIIAMGYYQDLPNPPKRKEVSEMVTYI